MKILNVIHSYPEKNFSHRFSSCCFEWQTTSPLPPSPPSEIPNYYYPDAVCTLQYIHVTTYVVQYKYEYLTYGKGIVHTCVYITGSGCFGEHAPNGRAPPFFLSFYLCIIIFYIFLFIFYFGWVLVLGFWWYLYRGRGERREFGF